MYETTKQTKMFKFYQMYRHNSGLFMFVCTGKDSGSIPKRLEVGLQLCHQFSPNTILSTACQLVQYLCNIPVDKGTLSFFMVLHR